MEQGSSVFGPTVVGLITDRWGDIRLSFWFILALLLVPLPFLYHVDVNRGKQAAEDFVKRETARAGSHHDGDDAYHDR
jgi:MFS transporter, UMF1 family